MFNQSLSRRSFLTVSAMSAASLALDWGKISAYTAKMGSKSDYPTVVIGAGLGGLVCGAYLAKQGVPVTVLEQHSIPGGYATSFDRAGGKFSFDVSLHGTSINTNAPARILNNIGVLNKIDLVQLPEVCRYKTPKFDISVPQRDPEEYIKRLSAHFPDEADGIRGFIEEMVAISEEENRLHLKKGRFFKLFFPFQYRKMWNVRHKTLADLMNDYVRNPDLQEILASLWGYYGLPPSKLSGFYYANSTGGYLRNGSYYIRQRSQDLSNAIAQVIEENGGRILYDSTVDRIRVEKGVVKGVELSGGETLPARAVVSNASAPTTFRKMVPAGAVPKEYLKKLRGYKPSISSFIVWLGLNRDICDITSAFSTHVSSGLRSDQDYDAKLNGDIENGSFGVAIYDNIFKGYSAPGTSTLQLIFISGYEPWRRFESNYRKENKTAYYEEKARWTDILIKRAERDVIPGLSRMIEVQEAATPLTNWRYTGNTDGAIYGFEQSMDNAYMNRIENHTPINGLYLAGAWGNPGGGYTGAMRSGEKAFQALMEDWGA
ncbi:MAG: NAD(P)/FAD-dependent oxidoreductase [Desulfobacterales bacterium]